jgi:hypothetical protein
MKLLFLVVTLFLNTSMAQDQAPTGAAGGMAVSVFTGPLLPNNIDGVTEIQSSWGARLAKVAEWVDFYEAGLLVSNAKGVELFNYFISAKIEVDTKAFLTQVYAGLDFLIYESNKGFDDKVFGMHAGTAFLAHISETIFFRTDMKLTFKPGNTLFIGFGLETRF